MQQVVTVQTTIVIVQNATNVTTNFQSSFDILSRNLNIVFRSFQCIRKCFRPLFFRWRFIACRKMHQINCVWASGFLFGWSFAKRNRFFDNVLCKRVAAECWAMQNVALQQRNSKCVLKTALGSMTCILYMYMYSKRHPIADSQYMLLMFFVCWIREKIWFAITTTKHQFCICCHCVQLIDFMRRFDFDIQPCIYM